MTEPHSTLPPAEGFVDGVVAAEFPGLRLQWASVPAPRRTSPRPVVRRLEQLAGRQRGASVVAMRTKPVPQAYRAFFRQIGLDPDVERIPSEQAAVARLLVGGFRSAGLIADACLIALVETGAPVWALDADRVDAGGPGIRLASDRDRGRGGPGERYLEPGALVVADRRTIHARLFAPPAPGSAVTRRTERVTLYTLGVDGVPAIHLDEALWICLELLAPGA